MRTPLLALLALLLAAPTALADVIPDEQAACQGKAKGDACQTGGEDGACEDDECCRLDYSRWEDKDASPPTTCSACLTCKPGGRPAPTDTSGAATDTAGSTTSGGDSGCAGTSTPLTGLLSLLAGLGLVAVLRRR